MGRTLSLVYGVMCYVMFLITFLGAINFVWMMDGQIFVGGPWVNALLINAALLSAFALQHSIMARQGFKRMWTKIVPLHIERSTYVLMTNVALLLMFRYWQPLPGTIWQIDNTAIGWLLNGIAALGWFTVLISTFLINHFELFGLSQVWSHFRGQTPSPPVFRKPGLYKFVRHPLYLGFIMAFWSTAHMTTAHLFFAIMTTGYILVAIQLEERDLVSYLGEDYKNYRETVPMLVPGVGGRG